MQKLDRVESPLAKPRLVAVQFQNGIGNFIMLTPAIKALCSHYNAKADIILDKSWTDSRRDEIVRFCELWELINEVKVFQDGFNKDNYEQLFYAYHGESSETHTYFKNNAEFESDHINWRAEKLHEVDYYMNMIYKMGYRGPIPSQHYVKRNTATFRPDISDSSVFRIGLCNGFFAGSRWQWERKGWPYFPELVKLIRRYFRGSMKIFLFGKGAVEKEWAAKIDDGQAQIVNTVDNCTLPETSCYMQYMDLFITTDTGLMHVADAIGIPTIAIFGATLVSKNGLRNKEHRVIRGSWSCIPCQLSPHFNTCDSWTCMKSLKPELVMAEVRSYLWDLVKRGRIRTRKNGGEIKKCLQ